MLVVEEKQAWLEKAWSDAGKMESSAVIQEGTSGHSQGCERWMALDFIVSNCLSELSLSPLPTFLFTAENLIWAPVCCLRKGPGSPRQLPLRTLSPPLDGSWKEAKSAVSGISLWLDCSISESFFPWIFFSILTFGPLKLKNDAFR